MCRAYCVVIARWQFCGQPSEISFAENGHFVIPTGVQVHGIAPMPGNGHLVRFWRIPTGAQVHGIQGLPKWPSCAILKGVRRAATAAELVGSLSLPIGYAPFGTKMTISTQEIIILARRDRSRRGGRREEGEGFAPRGGSASGAPPAPGAAGRTRTGFAVQGGHTPQAGRLQTPGSESVTAEEATPCERPRERKCDGGFPKHS